MTAKIPADAVKKAEALPLPDQERIGRDPNCYVHSLEALRDALDQGLRSLDAGLGRTLDMEDVIARANAGHGEP